MRRERSLKDVAPITPPQHRYVTVRLLSSLLVLSTATATICAAQSPPKTTDGVEVPVEVLRTIALDIDQRRDPLYCYFGTRVITPAVRVLVDSVKTVAAAQDCNGVGLAFVMRASDKALLIQLIRGVIESNPRFAVVSAYYATEDVDRFGDTVHVARSMSILRGVATMLAHDASLRDGP